MILVVPSNPDYMIAKYSFMGSLYRDGHHSQVRINTALINKYLFKPSSHALSSVLASVLPNGSSYSKEKKG